MTDSSVEAQEDVGPASAVSGLSATEIADLKLVGAQWRQQVGRRNVRLRDLPVDPGLHRFPRTPEPAGASRFTDICFVETSESGDVSATAEAAVLPSREGRLALRARRLVLGAPLASTAVAHERMRKLVALPILSSDALSSVAYGPEAMLAVLALAGSAALDLSLWISAAIVALMLAVGLSYRQLIKAYPHGGGSYVVAGENLGEIPALIAAAGLLIDYVLTVAVSISAGVAAVTSALPDLAPAAVPLGVGVIAVLLIGNLRGVREAGAMFSAPTYLFVLAVLVMVCVGLTQAAGRGFAQTSVVGVSPIEGISVLLVLRAFASGATAMTGIEAISNAVPALKPPGWRNARTVLSLMLGLLVSMFAGLVIVVHLDGLVPRPGQTLLSQLAHRSLGSGVLYGYVQASTALVLLLAANTAFNGFPRLLSFMAHKGHVPRLFLRLGDRLAFSNGTILLAAAAAAIFAAFDAKTDALIPLYAVGVFVAFTFSQAGMVVHWHRHREPHWRRSLLLNALGAVLSAVVFVVAAVTKFTQGAWVALLLIALLVLATSRIRRHYTCVREALELHPDQPAWMTHTDAPRSSRKPGDADHGRVSTAPATDGAKPRGLVVVPVARLDLSSLRALAYAASLGQPVLAVHLSPAGEEAKRFRGYWQLWGNHVPLQIVESPYRALIAPLARYIEELHNQQPVIPLTVVLPELIVKHFWQRPLHNQVSRRLGRALRHQPGILTTAIPLELP
ncbi:MAG TPA: APC family permease [Gaiellaceae bacterium]|nr:APC family permease [Gaiellaceae bacterium]